jgi:hypothetical protein
MKPDLTEVEKACFYQGTTAHVVPFFMQNTHDALEKIGYTFAALFRGESVPLYQVTPDKDTST